MNPISYNQALSFIKSLPEKVDGIKEDELINIKEKVENCKQVIQKNGGRLSNKENISDRNKQVIQHADEMIEKINQAISKTGIKPTLKPSIEKLRAELEFNLKNNNIKSSSVKTAESLLALLNDKSQEKFFQTNMNQITLDLLTSLAPSLKIKNNREIIITRLKFLRDALKNGIELNKIKPEFLESSKAALLFVNKTLKNYNEKVDISKELEAIIDFLPQIFEK